MSESRLKVLFWGRSLKSGTVSWESPYLFYCWLPHLGPFATTLVWLLADGLRKQPYGFEVEVSTVASWMGIASRASHDAVITRALSRASRCGFVTVRGSEVGVVTNVPLLSDRLALRLSPERQNIHFQIAGVSRGSLGI